MLKVFNKRLRNRKGFTLIELIVVIAVLGILASIAIPRLTGVTNDARRRTDLTNAKTIANAVSILLTQEQITPPASATKTIILDGDTTNDTVATDDNAISNYLETVPTIESHNEGTNFVITIDTSANVTVLTNDTTREELFPNPSATFGTPDDDDGTVGGTSTPSE